MPLACLMSWLRGRLHKQVQDGVIAEISIDLTGQPLDVVERGVRADLAKGYRPLMRRA